VIKIIDVHVADIRFPTSRHSDGSWSTLNETWGEPAPPTKLKGLDWRRCHPFAIRCLRHI